MRYQNESYELNGNIILEQLILDGLKMAESWCKIVI